MNKKGFVRTLEAGIAGMIVLIFIIFIAPHAQVANEEFSISILPQISVLPQFRVCAVEYNFTCINAIINETLPSQFDFVVDISESPDVVRTNLPPKIINIESVVIAGNSTDYTPRFVKLYFYKK